MIPEITLLRAIGILFVVLGHSDIFYQKTPYFYPIAEFEVHIIVKDGKIESVELVDWYI